MKTSKLFILGLAWMIIVAVPVFAQDNSTPQTVCGNGVCESGETPGVCSEDCTVTASNYIACAINEDTCPDDVVRDNSITIAAIFFGLGVFLYLRKKRFF